MVHHSLLQWIMSELSSMTYSSWVALHSMAYNFVALSQFLLYDVIDEGENCKYNYTIILQCCVST